MQLFLPQHYEAFTGTKPSSNEPSVIDERRRVRDALLELHDLIWPYIASHGWDLHRHRQEQHYVSSHQFVYLDDGTPVVQYIDGMWLHYGKSEAQLDFLKTIGGYDYSFRDTSDYYNAFYLHTRIQLYINSECFRCWLLLATDKNYFDRSEYLRRLSQSVEFRNIFFQNIQPLMDLGFFYEIDGIRLPITPELTQRELLKFVRRDRGGLYSGIVKEYLPNSPEIERENIYSEMTRNLELMYPLYNIMAWRPPGV